MNMQRAIINHKRIASIIAISNLHLEYDGDEPYKSTKSVAGPEHCKTIGKKMMCIRVDQGGGQTSPEVDLDGWMSVASRLSAKIGRR